MKTTSKPTPVYRILSQLLLVSALFFSTGAQAATKVLVEKDANQTLYRIHVNSGVPVGLLMHFNGLQSTLIITGKYYRVPNQAERKAILAKYPNLLNHVVQSGDTLFSIAKSYGSSVGLLWWANRLYDETIYPNQSLVVPVKSSSGRPDPPSKRPQQPKKPKKPDKPKKNPDTKERGKNTPPEGYSRKPPKGYEDWEACYATETKTLESLAKVRGTTAREIKKANGLLMDTIYPGTVIWLPKIADKGGNTGDRGKDEPPALNPEPVPKARRPYWIIPGGR